MPTLPPGLTEWLPSGIITAFFGLIWYEQKAGEARLNKRIDESRDGVNKRIDESRNGVNKRIDESRNGVNKRIDESRDGVNKRIDELKTDMKELREKVDALPWKLMEALRANQPVTPDR